MITDLRNKQIENGAVKGKFSLSLVENHALKVHGDIDGGECLPSPFGHFIFWKRDPGTHRIKGFDRVQIRSGRFEEMVFFLLEKFR